MAECRNTVRRYLIVPSDEMEAATVVRVEGADGTRQEAGLSPRQPTIDAASPPAGDIRLTLSGQPEVHIEGDLRITRSGPVDLGRYSFVREEDSQSTDLQLKQSPMVFGKRTDVLWRSTTLYAIRPKLLPLASGRVLLFWIGATNMPSRASGAEPLNGSIIYSILDPATDAWSAPAVMAIYIDSMTLPQITAVDAVQFADTGEVVVFATVNSEFAAAPADRRLYAWHAVDDGIVNTWYERSRSFLQGVEPDLILWRDDDVEDLTPIIAMAAEGLASGRIALSMVTGQGLYSTYSDDRGHTWANPTVIFSSDSAYPSTAFPRFGNLDYFTTRNGLTILLWAGPAIFASVTGDGASYSGDPTAGIGSPYYNLSGTFVVWGEANEAAGVVRADGWPQIYASMHRKDVESIDQLFARTMGTRDPGPSMSASEAFWPAPVIEVRPWYGFHYLQNPARDGWPDAGEYGGFTAVASCLHRGQILLAAVVTREDGEADSINPESNPSQEIAAVMVHRANHWQPLAERLAFLSGSAVAPSGRVYNRTWDCYDLPDQWGFANVVGGAGAGSAAIVFPGGVEGGYLRITTTNAAYGYSDTTPPNITIRLEGVVRACLQVVSGGDRTYNAIALRLDLTAGYACGIAVRFVHTGTAIGISLIDSATGGELGYVEVATDRWIEVIASIAAGPTGTCYARTYDREADPDWESPYVLVGSGALTSGSLTEQLSFGHLDVDDAESWWKSVALHRPSAAFETGVFPLARYGLNSVDNDYNNVLSNSGTPNDQNDAGADNFMRSPQYTANPAQWLSRGVHVTARGEALTQGDFDYASGYEYEGANLLAPPVLKEWRSAGDGQAITIVLDAGADQSFRPDGLAVFGRNCPELTLEMAVADSWASPPFRYRFGFSLDSAVDRYTHLWSHYVSPVALPGWSYACRGNRLTVYDANSTTPVAVRGPWRPHQFRSLPTGPRFYCAFRNEGAELTRVYRIRDNTADTLIFERDLITGDVSELAITGGGEITTIAFPFQFSIFSDRFSCLLEHRYPTTYTVAGSTPPTVKPNSHVQGYRYARITIPACTHRDEDEQFARLGYVLMGQAFELASPDAQWGWSQSQSSGHEVAYGSSGVGTATRRHSPRRELSLDYGVLMPPQESSRGGNSPEEARPDTYQSWAHWLDVLQRLEVDAVPAALVWEGDRAYGQAGEAVTTVASDPQSLWLARVVSPGTVEHVAWKPATLNTAVGVGGESIPRPICVVRGITFHEEF